MIKPGNKTTDKERVPSPELVKKSTPKPDPMSEEVCAYWAKEAAWARQQARIKYTNENYDRY